MRSPGEVIDLVNMIKYTGLKDFTMVEVGCFSGESTEVFLNNGAQYIYAVDMWQPLPRDYTNLKIEPHIAEPIFDACMKAYDGRVCKMKMSSEQAAESFKEVVDLVYIDACHIYHAVKRDIEIWISHIRPGGFITGHDFSGNHKGVMQAVTEKFTQAKIHLCGPNWVYPIC
jgi:hypothetical protein